MQEEGLNDSGWAALARASMLLEPVLRDIWIHGGREARKNIAQRRELPADITAAILQDPFLTQAWLRTERNPGELTENLIDLGTECRVLLATQPALPEPTRRALLETREPETMAALLEREDLTAAENEDLLVDWLSTQQLSGQSFGARLMGRIGSEPSLWTRILERIDEEQSGLLREGSRHSSLEVRNAAIRAAQRVLTAGPARNAEEILRTVQNLMKDPEIESGEFAALVSIPAASALATELAARATLPAADHLRLLHSCPATGFCILPDHEHALGELLSASKALRLPGETMCRAALAHPIALNEYVRRDTLGQCPTEALEALVEELEQAGEHERTADLLEASPYQLRLAAGRPAAIAALARRGTKRLLQTDMESGERVHIVEQYRPASDLVAYSEYVDEVVVRIADLPAGERETVYRLLPEWSGTFAELLEAARTL